MLVTDPLVWVPQGGMLQISRTVLHAELPGARDSHITYSIGGDRPRHGECLRSLAGTNRACFSPRVPQGLHALDESTEFWLFLGKRVFFAAVLRFLPGILLKQTAFEGVFPCNTLLNKRC